MRQLTIVKSTKPKDFKGRWCELADEPCCDQSNEFIGCDPYCVNNSWELISEKKLKGYIEER